MGGQRGGRRPACPDLDHAIEVFLHGLVDATDMRPDVTLQCFVGQVVDPLVIPAQVVQTFARRFETVVAAQELAIVAVGQVQQGDSADLLFDKGHARQGDGTFPGGILATHFQGNRQYGDALACGGPGLWGVGIDGDVQHL
ncbi:hypothetical protein D3C86_1604150 [compost metagenome]